MKTLIMFFALGLCPPAVCAQTAAPSPASASASVTDPATLKTGDAPTAPEKVAAEKNADRAARKREPVQVTRFEESPVIDGRLDEGSWQKAARLDGFYQIQPGDNIEPSQPTEVLFGYDGKHLYIGVRAYDEAGKVRATIAKRDDVLEDDNVRVILDTFNDQRRAYVFIFNPLGVQQDGLLTEGAGEDYSVDVLLESKGTVTDKGYEVEISIPFKSLRYVAGKDRPWGVHVFRRIKRYNNEQSSWMPISRSVSGLLNQAGQLGGLEGIEGGRTLELIPSFAVSEAGERVATLVPPTPGGATLVPGPDRFVNKPLTFDPGLTAKLGISSALTLDLALNPDFAQVEADETVVTANQRFPIFFTEKRPFFLEGIDIFQTSLLAVHTRAIVDPDVAVKLTGKRGRATFGVLLASDRAPGNFTGDERLDPDNQRFLDRNAYIGVVRLKRDVGRESSVGLLATTYNFIEKHNHVGGFDGRFRLDPKTVFEFQVLGSTSRRFFFDPQLGRRIYRTGNGLSYYFNFNRTGRNLLVQFDGIGRTEDYRSDVGFLRRTNTNTKELYIRYASDPKPKARLVSWRVFNSSRPAYDFQGRLQRWANETQVEFSFTRQAYLGGGFTTGYERVFEEEFGPVRTATRAGTFLGEDSERSARSRAVYVFGGITPNKTYSVYTNVTYTRGELDFDFGAGPRFPRVSPAALLDPDAPLDPGPGNSLNVRATLAYQPTDALRTTLDYTKSRLVRQDTGLVAFDTNIFALRSTYQFTRFTFARARVDYESLTSNLRAQFLVGWTPNPGTSFYAGYNDDLNRNGFSPFTGVSEPGFSRNRRTFFIKASYLIRRSF